MTRTIHFFKRFPNVARLLVSVCVDAVSYRGSCCGCEREEPWRSVSQTGSRDVEIYWAGENAAPPRGLLFSQCLTVFFKLYSCCLGGASVDGERSAPRKQGSCPSDPSRHFWTSKRSSGGGTTTQESRIQLHHSRYEVELTRLLSNLWKCARGVEVKHVGWLLKGCEE